LKLDPESHTFSKGGVEIHLQPKEFSLLEFFMRHPGQVFSLDAILDRLWAGDADASAESVRKHITRLRQKLQNDEDNSAMLKTVHGLGYKLEP
jgi:DNA-binding response OmpR family regulator